MNHTAIIPAVPFIAALLLSGCGEDKQADSVTVAPPEQAITTETAPEQISGTVRETMDAGGYTYVLIESGGHEYWAASRPTPVKPGDTIGFSLRMPMNNFHSKELDRDFEVIYFVNQFITDGAETASAADPHHGMSLTPTQAPVTDVEKAPGGLSIAELREQSQALAGKTVRVRGKVTKATLAVMDTNWIHIKDASTDKDLTFTTKAKVNIGDVVTAEGTLVLNKDAGFGYLYDVLLEDAKVTAN